MKFTPQQYLATVRGFVFCFITAFVLCCGSFSWAESEGGQKPVKGKDLPKEEQDGIDNFDPNGEYFKDPESGDYKRVDSGDQTASSALTQQGDASPEPVMPSPENSGTPTQVAAASQSFGNTGNAEQLNSSQQTAVAQQQGEYSASPQQYASSYNPSQFGSPSTQSYASNPSGATQGGTSYASASPGAETPGGTGLSQTSPAGGATGSSYAAADTSGFNPGSTTPTGISSPEAVAPAATPAVSPSYASIPAQSSGWQTTPGSGGGSYYTPSDRGGGGSGYFADSGGSSGNSLASVRDGGLYVPPSGSSDITVADGGNSGKTIDITSRPNFSLLPNSKDSSSSKNKTGADVDALGVSSGGSLLVANGNTLGANQSKAPMSDVGKAALLDAPPQVETELPLSVLDRISEFLFGKEGGLFANDAQADDSKLNQMDLKLEAGDVITIKCDDDVPFRISFINTEKKPVQVEAVNPVYVVENNKRFQLSTVDASVYASSSRGDHVVIESPGKNVVKIKNLGKSAITLSITRGDGHNASGNIRIRLVEGKDGSYISICSAMEKEKGFFSEHPVLTYALSSALAALSLILLVAAGVTAYIYRKKILQKQMEQLNQYSQALRKTSYKLYSKTFTPTPKRVL